MRVGVAGVLDHRGVVVEAKVPMPGGGGIGAEVGEGDGGHLGRIDREIGRRERRIGHQKAHAEVLGIHIAVMRPGRPQNLIGLLRGGRRQVAPDSDAGAAHVPDQIVAARRLVIGAIGEHDRGVGAYKDVTGRNHHRIQQGAVRAIGAVVVVEHDIAVDWRGGLCRDEELAAVDLGRVDGRFDVDADSSASAVPAEAGSVGNAVAVVEGVLRLGRIDGDDFLGFSVVGRDHVSGDAGYP